MRLSILEAKKKSKLCIIT